LSVAPWLPTAAKISESPETGGRFVPVQLAGFDHVLSVFPAQVSVPACTPLAARIADAAASAAIVTPHRT